MGWYLLTGGGSDNGVSPDVSIAPISTTAPNGAANGSPLVELHGFGMPINGGCLPKSDLLMPNAPRIYRNGVHEGIDFYDSDNCTRIARGTEVLAVKSGKVIRADLSYIDITAEEVARYSQNPNTEEALDKYRGRQVWIEHGIDVAGAKVVSRYAHLSGIAPGITVGTQVNQGQVVAFVGESGTPESVSSPGKEYHLHFELRIGDGYLGKALPPPQVRTLYLTLFGP